MSSLNLSGKSDWWNTTALLHSSDQHRCAEAISAASKRHKSAVQPGHVVAEFTFGFWTGLVANRYHERLWVPALHRAFPQLNEARRELHRKLETLRKLRNRIAHHEPAFARNLAADHERLLHVLEAISPEAALWVRQNSRVLQTLSYREQILNGTRDTTF